MKVLALGYIPKWKGGRQKTGLATGLFDLHDAVNALGEDVHVAIAATDIYQDEVMIDHTRVVGWKKGRLVGHAIKFFYRLPLFIRGALFMNRFSEATGGFASVLAKMVFLDYAIEREKPDVIHLHGCFYALFRDFLWHKNTPVVLRLHGINGYDPAIKGYLTYREMEKLIVRIKFEFVTFVTKDIADDWARLYGQFSCPMIPVINGYNENVFYPPKEDREKEFDLITISGLQERKGQDRVAKVLKILREKGKEYSYLVIGSGDAAYEQNLKQYVADEELKVTFVAYCPQDKLNDFLWKSRYFILATSSEGFGKVFIESMASGVPVILPANIPIARENGIFNEYNAVFMNDSSVESIVEVLENLPESLASARDISQSIAHLSWKNIAKQYVRLYNNLNG